MTNNKPTKDRPRIRVIKLFPEPELADQIDAAAAEDRRSSPAWVLSQVEKILTEQSVGDSRGGAQ
jgi:hypothetical protein